VQEDRGSLLGPEPLDDRFHQVWRGVLKQVGGVADLEVLKEPGDDGRGQRFEDFSGLGFLHGLQIPRRSSGLVLGIPLDQGE
jgi:hypothetical protein